MSQTLIWPITTGLVIRKNDDGTGGQGCGGSKHLYVGRSGSSGTRRNYTSYLKPTVNWTGVGKIVSATLVVYTDDFSGLMGQPATADTPTIFVRRLTDSFSEGNNSDGVFDSSDYSTAASTTSSQAGKVMAKALGAVNRIDITAIVKTWAPASVTGGSGTLAQAAARTFGIGLIGGTDTKQNWSGWSDDADDSLTRPTIELVYELGPTIPNTPASLDPAAPTAALAAFGADFSDVRSTDTLSYSEVEVYDAGHAGAAALTDIITSAAHGLSTGDQVYLTSLTGGVGFSLFTRYYVRSATTTTFKLATTNSDSTVVNVTDDYSALTWSKLVWTSGKVKASSVEVLNDRTNLIPSDLTLRVNTTYRWRIRQTDQEGQVSAFSPLASFSVTNTAPTAPVLKPLSGSSFATLDGVPFSGGTFADPNAGDYLIAFQVELSPFAEGSVGWLDADFLKWDTGKVYTPADATDWEIGYGGASLAAGTYYWRARVWDQHDGVSNWAYATIVLTADFDITPGSQTTAGIDPDQPYRVIIRDMYQADGVTKTVGRAPGRVVAILENAKSLGGAKVFNSPGGMHFTLGVDHPQISVIEPKQVHYAIEHYTGDGWRETYAGLVWDADANEQDVVFTGKDYLALYDYVLDERYFPDEPNRAAAKGGSKYTDKTIKEVVTDQLTRAKGLANSPVGFINIGSIATMNEKITIWSTMQPVLSFVSGLIDSHRQGTLKKTRIEVKKTTAGSYQVVVTDDPGQVRDNLRLKYGELVQGYRVIFFGPNWASVQHTIGRTREGIRVLYKTANAPGVDQTVFGRIAQASIQDGVTDEPDLIRRTQQAAVKAGKLGNSIALGVRSGVLKPEDGYQITDTFPVAINHGAVDTSRFGSGYWDCMAVVWEAGDNGEQTVNLTLVPRLDSVFASSDLIPTRPISPQAEWQLGWTPPDPLKATSKYWLDQNTGKVYLRDDDILTLINATGTV